MSCHVTRNRQMSCHIVAVTGYCSIAVPQVDLGCIRVYILAFLIPLSHIVCLFMKLMALNGLVVIDLANSGSAKISICLIL